MIGYSPMRDGRSSYLVKHRCGATFDFYVWSMRKRCPRCKALFVYSRGGVGILDEQRWVVLGEDGQVIA